MNRQIMYPLIVLLFFVLVVVYFRELSPWNFAVVGIDRGKTNTFMWIISSISILLAIIIFFEGRYYKNMQIIAVWIVLTRLIDIVRFSMFPDLFFIGNIISLFGGILIFAHGMGLIKDVIFKRHVGMCLVVIGWLTFFRFPFFVDFLLYYNLKFSYRLTSFDGYYRGVTVVYFIIVFFELLALNGIVKENRDTFKYNNYSE